MNILRYPLLLATACVFCACASSRTTNSPGATPTESPFRVDQVSMATENTELMVVFYQNVFGARFTKLPSDGHYIYTGTLFGLKFVLVPNDVANVRAERSRHELHIIVPNIEDVIRKALMTGATLVKGVKTDDNEKTATLIDPDGNSMVVVEKL